MNRKCFALLFVFIFGFILACGSDDNDEDTMAEDGMGVTDDSSSAPIMGFSPCENGMASEFPCNGYDLLGRIQHSTFSAREGNDIWGWTDTSTSKEYALIGLDNGTAFVDITDTENLVYLGKLPTATTSSTWRDIKVYGDHAFIVSEANNHGMQVFDLTRLRTVDNPPITFESDARYTEIGNAHNVVIIEAVGFAYPVGTAINDAFLGGVHFVDISDASNPIAAGGYGADGYTHDAQVVTYNGPDTDYTGREIFIGSNEDRVVIVDITDKSNPVAISAIDYPQVHYTHQGWLTEDQRYFLLGDEVDEIQVGFNSRTIVFDFSDLDNPEFHFAYSGPTAAIDHNGYVKGNEFFLANYTAGMRVVDISDIENRNMSETGFFDTFPTNDNTSFSGVWSVYPYFESGKIIINDSNTGFFVVQKSE
ncbi:MAG: choice-of-anchor B family protein [Croceivirga sp.]